MNRKGFTLIEIMIAMGLITVLLLVSLSQSSFLNSMTGRNRTSASRDRIVSGIRSIAGMPAALRNSMRAADMNGNAVNPSLFTCLGGQPAGNCNGGVNPSPTPFTLYLPTVTTQGIQPISAPSGAPNGYGNYDTFGQPCGQNQGPPRCPLTVTTSFKSLCPPNPLAQPLPAPLSAIQPMNQCTVADTIEVDYSIQLDPSAIQANPSLSAFSTPVTGSVFIPAHAISGNTLQ